MIYNTLIENKIGWKIIIESKNGQKIEDYKFTASGPLYEYVNITDYFKIENEEGKLVLTAIQDSLLRIDCFSLYMEFEQI